ncbi:redox-sensing transcriptional repressor Rex [Anaerobacillus sp. 1_MG-2023]|uniref:redox-sensing transcriptional repressor Rex n=1 Tax=Bacillales TaxID=1385 RepID=UPI0026E21C97|nr:redox-sensing transcriptional repressor Rex [Anaerobacillus sp. 1_MG-2023]MDO6654262.1 redox-sensing transcriptional repressor Rex [Anaerobacillus sp. 1_MG-2023]
MKKEENKLPNATIKRLPLYLSYLKSVKKSGQKSISSVEIGNALNYKSDLVRRDFSKIKAPGRKGAGYEVKKLVNHLHLIVNEKTEPEATLIGAGRLGTALLHYNHLRKSSPKIKMAFDNNPKIVGKTIAGVPVYHIDEMYDRLTPTVTVAILAIPAASAQLISEKLSETGIIGIMNFSSAYLQLPANIHLQQIDLARELDTLSFLIHFF